MFYCIVENNGKKGLFIYNADAHFSPKLYKRMNLLYFLWRNVSKAIQDN